MLWNCRQTNALHSKDNTRLGAMYKINTNNFFAIEQLQQTSETQAQTQ